MWIFIYLYFYFILLVESKVGDFDLIPREPKGGCLLGSVTRKHFITCICEDHCRWDMCRLKKPPEDCLFYTSSKWTWNSRENAWIAQRTKGYIS